MPRPVARGLTALCSLVLLLLAALVPATPAAAAGREVSGTLVLPPGVGGLRKNLELWTEGGSRRHDVTVPRDGRFSFTSFVTFGERYQLRLSDTEDRVEGGWVTADGSTSPDRSQALVVTAPVDDVVVRPRLRSDRDFVTVRVETPAGYEGDLTDVEVALESEDAGNWWSVGTLHREHLAPDGTAVLLAAPPTAGPVRLRVRDRSGHLLEGWLAADGTLGAAADGVDVLPGQTLVVRPGLAGVVTGTVAAPEAALAAGGLWVTPYKRSLSGLWVASSGTRVGQDGSFAVRGLEPGAPVRLEFAATTERDLERGFWREGADLVWDVRHASDVTPPRHDLRVTMRENPAFTGRLVLDPRFTVDPDDPPRVRAYYEDDFRGEPSLNYRKNVPVAPDGTFTLDEVHSSRRYAVAVVWPGGEVQYWRSDEEPVDSDVARATWLTPPRALVLRQPSRIIGTPTVSHHNAAGSTITVTSPGTWFPEPSSISYQWLRDGEPVPGATGTSYLITPDDGGTRLSVRLTVQTEGLPTATATSAAQEVILNRFTERGTPTVSGTPAVGETLTADPGSWVPTPDRVTYQWFRNYEAIPEATSPSYTPVPEDEGANLYVAVTAERAHYRTETGYSGLLRIAPASARPGRPQEPGQPVETPGRSSLSPCGPRRPSPARAVSARCCGPMPAAGRARSAPATSGCARARRSREPPAAPTDPGRRTSASACRCA